MFNRRAKFGSFSSADVEHHSLLSAKEDIVANRKNSTGTLWYSYGISQAYHSVLV